MRRAVYVAVARAQRRRALAAQHAAVDDRAHATAEVERAVAAAPSDLVERGARRRGHELAGAVLGEPPDDEPARARGGSAARCSSAIVGRGRASAVVDDDVEHLRLVAQQLGRAQRRCARRPGGPRAAPARARRARARARTGRTSFVASSRHASPRARQYAAVSSRVTPSSGRTSRPSRGRIPSSARRPGDAASR